MNDADLLPGVNWTNGKMDKLTQPSLGPAYQLGNSKMLLLCIFEIYEIHMFEAFWGYNLSKY